MCCYAYSQVCGVPWGLPGVYLSVVVLVVLVWSGLVWLAEARLFCPQRAPALILAKVTPLAGLVRCRQKQVQLLSVVCG